MTNCKLLNYNNSTINFIYYNTTTITIGGLGVGEWLVSAVMSVCSGAKTVVGAVCGGSGGFEVRVGVHRGSALGPLLFVMVMEALSREFRVALPVSYTHLTLPTNREV